MFDDNYTDESILQMEFSMISDTRTDGNENYSGL